MLRIIRHGSRRPGVPPIVAVPGIDGSEASILPIVQKLAAKREVFVVNYSDESNRTLEALTFEVAELVRAERLERLDLLGQSIGTIVVSQLAGLNALPARKVVLIATFTQVRGAALRLGNLVAKASPPFLYRTVTPALMGFVCGPVGDGRDHPFFAATRDSDRAAVPRRTAWQIGRDFSSDLAKVAQPTLIILGDSDRFVPFAWNDRRKLKSIFRDREYELILIPGAGHVLLPSHAIERAVSATESFLS